MVKSVVLFQRKRLLLVSLFLLCLTSVKTFGQSGSGLLLKWDKEVGCQMYQFEKERSVYLESIGSSECIRVCEYSQVTYTLQNLPAGATTTWNVVGGSISNPTNNTCVVSWGEMGSGSLSFLITVGNAVINKTVCFEKVISPTAKFKIAPHEPTEQIYACSNQNLFFNNLSTANGGSGLVNYYWDFGDGTTSTAFEPSHAYLEEGLYTVYLKVTNACHCTSETKMEVKIMRRGFEISCPTVICEGQTETYSLPFDGKEICHDHYLWETQGGTILSEAGGNVEVQWDNVDESGFGYLTFIPEGCQLECLQPTTAKIPVIQTRGTIQGPHSLCKGEQGKYKLPQWPTTDFQWEIVGNTGNNLAQVIPTDQRNEVIITPLASGTLTLRATYMNTLLHCGGTAEFIIEVGKTFKIEGPDNLCLNEPMPYTNSESVASNWTLTTAQGVTVTTQEQTESFYYEFTTPGNYILTTEAPGYCKSKQKVITVLPIPTIPNGVVGNTEVCPNSTYTYTVQNPDPNSEYRWWIINGSVLGSDMGNQVNVTFNGTFPAYIKLYKVSLTPISCVSEPKIITINRIPVNAAISSNNAAICANSLATYQALIPGTSTLHTDGDTYNWSFANASGPYPAHTLGSVSTGQGTNSVEITWNNVTTVTTVDLVLTIGKCNLNPAPQFIKHITLYPKAQIAISTPTNPICGGSLYPVTFTVQSANGVPLSPTDVVTWNIGSGDFTTAPGVFTYTTNFNNTSSSNIGVPITAYIANANGCGQTNTANYLLTILPNPPAVLTLTSPANAFCTVSEINATVTISSNISGLSFTWYKNGVPLSGYTGTSLNITPSLGFGSYTFRVTNSNGCIAQSNPIRIVQVPCDPINCFTNETIINSSYLSACGQITLQGSYTGTPISTEFNILGPSPTDYSISGNTLTGKPGNYKIIYKVVLPCINGGYGTFTSIKDVVIPYMPDFKYTVQCNGNNTFNVNFIDNSSFYDPVINKQIRFYYKAPGASTFTGPIAYNPSLSIFELNNVAGGNYTFKLEIEGTLSGTPTYVCSKQFNVNLQGISATTAIEVNSGDPINCHDNPVKFSLNNISGISSVIWNFGDNSTNTNLDVSKVFNTPDQNYTVTCTITNVLGCSKVLTTTVYIPKACFSGTIVANPTNASVCEGQGVTLSYQAGSNDCAINQYTWMNGNTPIPGATNPTLTVYDTGFYWVKVNNTNGCKYFTPNQIKPVFNVLPSVKFLGATSFCQNDAIKIKISSNGEVKWYMDGVYYPQFDNSFDGDFTGLLAAGPHTISILVSSYSGCTKTFTQNIVVEEPIHNIAFDVQIHCDPYQVSIKALPSNGSNIQYNWSNGDTGNTMVATHGGPFEVTATTGGCTTSAQIVVPKSPEEYVWIFPTGCYQDCSTDTNYLIGPNLPLKYWSWNNDNNSQSSGYSSFPSPYTLTKDGAYTFTLNTGACELESKPLHYTTTKCDKCKLERVSVDKITPIDGPFCAYTATLYIVSNYTFPIQVSLSDEFNNVIIIPSTFTIQPGISSIIPITIIPQSPFTGGVTEWNLQGTVTYKEKTFECLNKLMIDIPTCEGGGTNNKTADSKLNKSNTDVQLTLYPNPVQERLTLEYKVQNQNSLLEIYDITGHLIDRKNLSSYQGQLSITTQHYPSGIYIVVLKDGTQHLWQQKIIKN